MKKKIFAGVIALSLMAGMALVAGSASAHIAVEICHKGRTISVAMPAVAAHERHGDTVGACGA